MSEVLNVRIGDFCETGSGSTPPRDQMARYFDGGAIPWVKSGELRESIINATEEHVTEAALKETSLKLVPANALLVAMYGATVGRLGILGVQATTNQAVCHIVPDPKRADVRYLFRVLETKVSEMLQRTVGGAQPNINQGIVRDLRVPLPPLEEQRRIAAILDQAETLRTQRRQALAHLDTLTQYLFLDMFGDPVANPKQWDVVQFGTRIATSLRNGLSPSSDGKVTAKVLTLSAITGVGFNADAWKLGAFHTAPPVQQSVDVDDFLVCRGNGNVRLVGKGYFPDQSYDDVTFPDTIIAARINVQLIAREYLQFIWNSSAVRRQVEALARTTNGTFKVNQTMLESIQIVMPPLALQQTFATRIQAIEALKATHRAALAQLDALFASLQQRAFAGELTVQARAAVTVPPVKRSFAELGQLNALKGVESLVYAAKRLPGKGHYWPTKVQYFADKRHLERCGRSIYGETYVALGRGPVPQAAYNASRALAEGELICEFPMDVVHAALRREGNQLIALRDADMDALDVQERESLDWAIRYVRELEFDELQTASHDAAWQKTVPNAAIAWRDILATLEPEVQKRLLEEFE